MKHLCFFKLFFFRDEAGTPIIDQITALQIAGSAMFGTAEGMKDPPSSQVKVEDNILCLVFIYTLYRIKFQSGNLNFSVTLLSHNFPLFVKEGR